MYKSYGLVIFSLQWVEAEAKVVLEVVKVVVAEWLVLAEVVVMVVTE